MSAHRVLKDLFRAYEAFGPGIGVDPGDAGTMTVDKQGQFFPIVTAGAETRTLAQPSRPGILSAICLSEDGGDLTLTVTGGYNNDDDTSITFDDAGDVAVFYSMQEGTSFYWRLIAQEGTNAAVETGNFDTLSIGGTAITATAAEINNAADLSAAQRAVTATADGLTTGLLTTADFGRFLTITSANADHIVVLPAAGADYIGGTIEMWVGANGFEVRANGTGATINGLDCKTINEMAIAATHRVRFTLVAAETWLAEGDTELGARVTLVADAV